MAYMFLQHCKLSLIYHIAPAGIANGLSFLRQFLLTAWAATSVCCKAFDKNRHVSILYSVIKLWSNSVPHECWALEVVIASIHKTED